MPVYEYRCESCGIDFEFIRKMSDPDPVSHPGMFGVVCGPVQRRISAPAIRPNGIAPSGSDAPALHNTGNKVRRLWMDPDGSTKEQKEWRPAFDGDPGRQVG